MSKRKTYWHLFAIENDRWEKNDARMWFHHASLDTKRDATEDSRSLQREGHRTYLVNSTEDPMELLKELREPPTPRFVHAAYFGRVSVTHWDRDETVRIGEIVGKALAEAGYPPIVNVRWVLSEDGVETTDTVWDGKSWRAPPKKKHASTKSML